MSLLKLTAEVSAPDALGFFSVGVFSAALFSAGIFSDGFLSFGFLSSGFLLLLAFLAFSNSSQAGNSVSSAP